VRCQMTLMGETDLKRNVLYGKVRVQKKTLCPRHSLLGYITMKGCSHRISKDPLAM
jgi:hypothetical protein